MSVPETDLPKPILNHLLELRQRLLRVIGVFFITTLISYCFAETLFQFLMDPLTTLLQKDPFSSGERKFIYTGLTEAFLTHIKISIFSGFFMTFPYLASEVWLFTSPALFQHERRLLKLILFATPFFFILGSAFAYYVIFPNAYQFFLSFESSGGTQTLPIQLEPRVAEYLSFVMRLLLAFGISFQLPVFLTVLASMGTLSSKTLIQKWRISVVIIFTLAAFITPPDILSMVGLAIPLLILYALSICMVKLMEKPRIYSPEN